MEQDEQQIFETLPRVPQSESPQKMMWLYLSQQLPIAGGWGYGKDDAVVITTDNPMEGVGLEYVFAEQRAKFEVLELDNLHPQTEHYFESYRSLQQSLRFFDDIPYDVIEGEVTVTDDDGLVTIYRTECWFNIKQFFGKY